GRRFRVVHTPGHCRDHVSFFEEETGWLFAGDAYLGRMRVARPDENVPQIMASLELMQALGPERLFPAHGVAIDRRPGEALSDTLQYLEDLQARARTLQGRGKSVKAIAKELLGPEPFLSYVSGGEFSARRLIESLLFDEAVPERELPSPFAPPRRSGGGPVRADPN
ncbi:MAG TPA: MBL fold metallo-hydrolase, partial [Candidatus Thermoplasmatota archaeon]|nr:MBL fold metallo-hydrolase [Candidatus Thermoplasmatota archaeon]